MGGTEVVGLRESKKQQTRQVLRDVAMRLFATQGYDATTIAEIADTARVSRRTFFRYFPCKEALLFSTDEEVTEHLLGALAARPRHEPLLTSLRAALVEAWRRDTGTQDERRRLRVELLDTHPSITAYAVQAAARLEPKLAAFAADRLGVAPHDPEPVAFAQLCSPLWRQWISGPDGPDHIARLDAFLLGLERLVTPTKDPTPPTP
jgi:AcrR family transcriptional regulator